MNTWDKLSMKEKHAFIRTAVKNGLSNLDEIRESYNSFANGGYKEQLINWAVNNEGALWQDTQEAAAARQWLRNNAPEELDSLYWVMSDTNRAKVDRRFLSDSIKEKLMQNIITSGNNSVGETVYKPIKTALDFTPIVGDVIQGVEAGIDLSNRDYLSAGLGVAGLLVPNIIEKPIKFIRKLGKVAINTPKYFKIKKAINNSKYWESKIDKIRQEILDYNINRENSIFFKNPYTRNIYETRLSKPRTVQQIDSSTGLPLFDDYGNPIYTNNFGTNVRVASWKEDALNILKGRNFSAEAGAAALDDVIIHPMAFNLEDYKVMLPSVLAHEFQHRAQTALGFKHLGKEITRPKLNAFIPTEKTPDPSKITWGIPNKDNPAYLEMSVLEGEGRDPWIQSPDEVDAEMAYVRNIFHTNKPFLEMTKDQVIQARDYIASRFKLTPAEAFNLLKSMYKNGYANGGTLNNTLKKPFSYFNIPEVRYDDGGPLTDFFSKIKSKIIKGKDINNKESEYLSYFDATPELLENANLSTKLNKYDTTSTSNYGDKHYDVFEARYKGLKAALKDKNFAEDDIQRLLPFLITQNILEGGWRLNTKDNNFGGLKYSKGNENVGNIVFETPEEFYKAYIENLDKYWGDDYLGKGKGWRNAKSIEEYAKIINREDLGLITEELYNEYNKEHPNKPAFLYTPEWTNNHTPLMHNNKFGGIYPRVAIYMDLINKRMKEFNSFAKTNNLYKEN